MFNNYNPDNFTFPGDSIEEIKSERKYISKFFLFFTGAYVLSYTIMMMIMAFSYAFDPESGTIHSLEIFLSNLMMPLCIVCFLSFSRKLRAGKHPVMNKMTIGKFLCFFLISVFIMVVGSFAGTFVNVFIGNITGNDIGNVVEEAIGEMSMLEIFISAVVCAAVFEELLFRKILIDKLSRYGTPFCIIISGLMFGLIHGNFSQFFYAFALGSLFAYIYCTYGNILYTIILHSLINTIGAIVPLLLGIDETELITPAWGIYMIFYFAAFVSGAILLFTNINKAKFYMVGGCLINPYKALAKNPGFIIAIIVTVLGFVISIFA